MNSTGLVGLQIGAINMLIKDLRKILNEQYTDDNEGTINIVVDVTAFNRKITLYCYDISIHTDEQITLSCKVADAELE